MRNPQKLISWLKYLDIEYLDDASCDALAKFDINNAVDQAEIVRLVMRPEVENLNTTSRSSMKKILDEIGGYPEAEVHKLISEVSMPFATPLQDYLAFFEQVRRQLFDEKNRPSHSQCIRSHRFVCDGWLLG